MTAPVGLNASGQGPLRSAGAWLAGLLVLSVPLAVRAFRRAETRELAWKAAATR